MIDGFALMMLGLILFAIVVAVVVWLQEKRKETAA